MPVTPETPAPDEVRNNPGEGRFELSVGDRLAFLNYRVLTRGELGLIHTEVPEELSGRGVGSALVEGALLIAREKEWTVLPYCPFVHGWMRRDTRFADLISYRYPKRDELVPAEPERQETAGEDAGDAGGGSGEDAAGEEASRDDVPQEEGGATA
jgi:hypothetical protein